MYVLLHIVVLKCICIDIFVQASKNGSYEVACSSEEHLTVSAYVPHFDVVKNIKRNDNKCKLELSIGKNMTLKTNVTL